MLIERLNASTGRQTSEMLNTKLPNVFEGLNALIWLLVQTNGSRTVLLSHSVKQRRKERQAQRVDSELRYHISASKNNPLDIFSTIRNHKGDLAYHVRFSGLQSH